MNERLTPKEYNIAIGLILFWGFAINIITCTLFADAFAQFNQTAILIGYIVLGVIGIAMSSFSTNPIVSFIGYNLVVVPLGVTLSITLKDVAAELVLQACVVTAMITIIMIVAAILKPDVFESMGITLFICLCVALIVEIIMILVGFATPKWFDFIVVLIFSGYIGYDWAKAQAQPKTLDNAVDAAVALYLDIINIFLRLLRIMNDD